MRFYVETDDGFLTASPQKIVCYDDGDGEWTIDVEGIGGQCLRDAWGNYPASVWIDSENNRAPMDERQAIGAARGLRRQMEMPSLPILIWRDGGATPVTENVTN